MRQSAVLPLLSLALAAPGSASEIAGRARLEGAPAAGLRVEAHALLTPRGRDEYVVK